MTTYGLVHGAWHKGELMEAVALPAALPWHPRLSEKLGFHRDVWMPGSPEMCVTDPKAPGERILLAGRD